MSQDDESSGKGIEFLARVDELRLSAIKELVTQIGSNQDGEAFLSHKLLLVLNQILEDVLEGFSEFDVVQVQVLVDDFSNNRDKSISDVFGFLALKRLVSLRSDLVVVDGLNHTFTALAVKVVGKGLEELILGKGFILDIGSGPDVSQMIVDIDGGHHLSHSDSDLGKIVNDIVVILINNRLRELLELLDTALNLLVLENTRVDLSEESGGLGNELLLVSLLSFHDGLGLAFFVVSTHDREGHNMRCVRLVEGVMTNQI
mmetsp:Transcript_94957/g.131959  ORF Transcript_94957/g.131959 Transcript_94957/m.131959 type:complete len:259 (+) Transcript_94957:458-1234(+)